MIVNTVLLGLAAAGSAYAQCSATATVTVQNQGDATGLAGCRTYSGSIAIATNYVGELRLSGIQQLRGNLVASNVTQLLSLSADSLSEITGDFTLTDVTNLASIAMNSLRAVGGNILWNAVTSTQTVAIGPIQKARSLRIENTNIQNLDGFDLTSTDDFIVVNNGGVQRINAQLGNVTNRIIIQGNSQNPTVSFPKLLWAANITLEDLSSVDLPALQRLNGSLAFSNNQFDTFSAPNLTDVGQTLSTGGSLVFTANNNLKNVSLPLLKRIGGSFSVTNNTGFETLDGVPKLETIIGALEFRGDFKEVTLPALNSVKGTFNILSTEDIQSSCGKFSDLKNQKKIEGKYACVRTENPNDQSANNGGNGGGNGGNDSAAGQINASSRILVGLGALAVALFASM